MTAARASAAIALFAIASCGNAQTVVDRALQRMRAQSRADAYEVSAAFADGKVMQSAPASTIAREDAVDPVMATGRDSLGASLTRVPLPVTPALLQRGRSRFRIVCAACHGAGGFGGSIVAENWPSPRPPSLRSGSAAGLPPGMVYQVIQSGFGRMPPYASDLTVADRWAVVAYVQAFRERPPADSAERDDSARADRNRELDSLGRSASR